jgi:CBS domain containing-hemolysin-like protein
LDDNYLLLRFALLGILLLISAFFSASEVALFSLNPVQLAELKEKSGRPPAGKTSRTPDHDLYWQRICQCRHIRSHHLDRLKNLC